ncbi:glycosyltransferase [Pullulanibacillus sp. KACC 23026]|uniref:glycosyltransferase n=1 Tax=Pullulanibacillus sp. KACC 23026 TaxID=3028315 RepID=UPI0023AF1254|nr:glycosyltransferase [Pullulanibacillus sp. KACC 23026]WEG11505.1 glycosyltransferase [Pullulanibacillus sp. KACC 23026]
MTNKQKLLFVIDSLNCAGAEKSLVTLLNLLDFSQVTVDLLLFGYGGELEPLVPKEVHLLQPLKYSTFSQLSLKRAFKYAIIQKDFNLLLSRLKYSASLRANHYSNAQKARVFWECVSPMIESNPHFYDVAISYAQGIPTFYVSEKVKANKKLAWVNVSYRLTEKDRLFQQSYYELIDQIVCVSESTKDIFMEMFPSYRNKTTVIYDLHDPTLINEMASLGEGFDDKFDGLRILTIGRLAYQKGYDLALEACKRLKENGIYFKWYVLGKGPLQDEINQFIKANDLQDCFKLLGITSNPYPYIKNADIYVQTSRYEGYGLAIAEARMLNTPVITTRFDAVDAQMIDQKNGLVVDLTAEAVCEGIMRLINDPSLRTSIVEYLKKEKKENYEELLKFYKLLNDESLVGVESK